MYGSETRGERLRQTGCGGCIAGTLGALLTWVVLILAGMTQFFFPAIVAAFLGIGGLFAAWLHRKRVDRPGGED